MGTTDTDATFIDDMFDEPIQIGSPTDYNKQIEAVIAVSVWEDGDNLTWCGNREQLRKLIETLQQFEAALPPAPNHPESNS